jgi:FMN phosphatase YigB (HAD superfamily)
MAVITFDLNGTLLDPGDQADVLQRAIVLSMAYTLTGNFRGFSELIEASGGQVPDEQPPFEDVAAGLDRLRAAGHELAVITNSSRETGEQHLAAAGLRDLFTSVASAEEVRAYKPSPEVYDLIPSDWHVAAHWFDVLGASSAGRRTVYIARQGQLPPTIEADMVIKRLDELEIP